MNGINPLYDIVFTYSYPRLDINVSTGLNHLLKSPFCVHPSTGFVCVPIDPSKCEDFAPLEVPRVDKLIEEINKYEETKNTEGEVLKDYKKTSLNSYIKYFKTQFLQPLIKEVKTEQQQTQSTNNNNNLTF